MFSVEKCQLACEEKIISGCSWFLYELDSYECTLLNGSTKSLASQCNIHGYPRDPDYSECNEVFDVSTDEGCNVSMNLVLYIKF